MKLSEVKSALVGLEAIDFELPSGEFVPQHFHVTEVGNVIKQFIDCGGIQRKETLVSFQLWSANDFNHRLSPKKLLRIIELAEEVLEIQDVEVEVEYQAETIARFGLDFNGSNFTLTTKQTDCLAKDSCGIPEAKENAVLTSDNSNAAQCTPGGGCC